MKYAKISGVILGPLMLGGCSIFNSDLHPDYTVSLPGKKIELYDHNKDGKFDKVGIELTALQDEQIFKNIIRKAAVQYTAKDRDFNDSWDTIGYIAHDPQTKNTITCTLSDMNSNGVYEHGVLNIVSFADTGMAAKSVFFRDIDECGTFEVRIYRTWVATESLILRDFNVLAATIQSFMKKELEIIKSYKKQ